ncbi:MAG: FkbM family methyltransferase [Myxococcota bacterium]|jgi:FkbM family methyltransferase
MMSANTKRWLRRVVPAPARHFAREMVYGPRVDEVELVHKFMGKSSQPRVMMDVGAHKGAALEAFARDGWKVLGFEPDPDTRSELEDFCSDKPNVKIDPRALSNRTDDELPWFRSDLSSGISSLSAFHESHEPAGFVTVTTAAKAMEDHKIENVDFLKIDAEGNDLFVLQGFPFEWIKPDVIVCEFEDDKTEALGYNFRDMADFLVGHGYHLLVSEWYPITRYGTSHRWRRYVPYPCELVNLHAWGNIIAVKDVDEFARLRSLSES